MAKISVYINSLASCVNQQSWEEEIAKILFRHEVRIFTPESIDELNTHLQNDIKNQTDTVITIGGDGTINATLKKIAGSGIKLLTIPGGTANDLAGHLGVQKYKEKFIPLLQFPTTSNVDLIKINEYYMVTNGGIGLPFQVADKINRLRKKYPFFKKIMKLCRNQIYSIFAFSFLFFSQKKLQLVIESPDLPGKMTITTCALLVNNQPRLGNKFNIAPSTINNDGKFNVCIFTHKDHLSFIIAFLKIRFGIYPSNDKQIYSFETDQIKISSVNNETMGFLSDGETNIKDRFFHIKISNKKINFYCHDPQKKYTTNISLKKEIQEI